MTKRRESLDERAPPERAVLRLDGEARRIAEFRLKGDPNAPWFEFAVEEWLNESRKRKAKR